MKVSLSGWRWRCVGVGQARVAVASIASAPSASWAQSWIVLPSPVRRPHTWKGAISKSGFTARKAKRSGRPVHELAGIATPAALTTAFTISLAAPADMAKAAANAASRALLKIKLGADGDPDRIAAVRNAAPKATLIVDANEGWTEGNLGSNLAACAQAGVALIEQPLPAGKDEALARIERTIPVCADESMHDRASLPALAGKYEAVNIKLDKTGGLTEALATAAEAERKKFTIMVGCMVATSLAMAPAVLLAQTARFVDLDGPLLLSKDRPGGLRYQGSLVYPPAAALWG